MLARFLLAAVLFGGCASAGPALRGTTYFIDPAGTDDAPGTRPEAAWRTLARATRDPLKPGDRLLLKRGAAWSEGLRLRGRGTPDHPILLGAFGDGSRPRIDGGPSHAISAAEPVSAWRIEGLELTSANDKNPTRRIRGGTSGIFLKQSEPCEALAIVDCIIRETSGPGIHLVAGGKRRAVFSDAVIERCEISNASCGIQFIAEPDYGPEYFPRFRIAHVTVRDIGGDGIVPFCGSDGVVEHCRATRTGLGVDRRDHSPVAIWLCWNRNSVIHSCEAWDNRDGGKGADGGGFDIDGGCEGCVMQYNFSHDNEGAGYLICTWDRENYPTRGNICRYNLSIDDGTKNGYGSVTLWQAEGSEVYGNTFVTRGTAALKFMKFARDNLFAGNIFMVTGEKPAAVVTADCDIRGNSFRRNLYHKAAGAPFLVTPAERLDSIEVLVAHTDGEGERAGDPLFADPATGNYRLRPGSPALGEGHRRPDPGARDYYGTPIGRPFIGAAGPALKP